MTRILYIASDGRSGSTLVTTVLGQLDGVLAAGELRFLWQRGAVENRPCGCGQPFLECSLWSAVMAKLDADPAPVASALHHRLRIRRLLGVLRRRRVPGHPTDATIAELYGLLAADLVVDSSKPPTYGLLLAGLPDVEVRVLHLVRDPRATAFSWRRKRGLDGPDDERLMSRPPVAKSALLWLVWNTVAALLWRRSGRYLRMRYEDFVADPEAATRRIAAFAGVDGDFSFLDPGAARLAATHSVAGNPARHRSGAVPLVADREWVTALSGAAYLLITMITAPALRAFGYGFRRRKV